MPQSPTKKEIWKKASLVKKGEGRVSISMSFNLTAIQCRIERERDNQPKGEKVEYPSSQLVDSPNPVLSLSLTLWFVCVEIQWTCEGRFTLITVTLRWQLLLGNFRFETSVINDWGFSFLFSLPITARLDIVGRKVRMVVNGDEDEEELEDDDNDNDERHRRPRPWLKRKNKERY